MTDQPNPVSSLSESAPPTTWNDKLWEEAERLAAKLPGDRVVRALADTSEAVWGAGLDHAFAGLSLKEASAFDVSWLSVFIVNLSSAGSGSESGSTPDLKAQEQTAREARESAWRLVTFFRGWRELHPDELQYQLSALESEAEIAFDRARMMAEDMEISLSAFVEKLKEEAPAELVSAASPGRPEELDAATLVELLEAVAQNFHADAKRQQADDAFQKREQAGNRISALAIALPSLIDAAKERDRLRSNYAALLRLSTRQLYELRSRAEAAERSNVAGLIEINRLGHVEAALTQALSRASELEKTQPELRRLQKWYDEQVDLAFEVRRIRDDLNALRSARDQSLKAIEELPRWGESFGPFTPTEYQVSLSAVLAILRGSE